LVNTTLSEKWQKKCYYKIMYFPHSTPLLLCLTSYATAPHRNETSPMAVILLVGHTAGVSFPKKQKDLGQVEQRN
jgi:hypothetical protein